MDNNNILQKLEGLESRYEEVSTLITDPDVIKADYYVDSQLFIHEVALFKITTSAVMDNSDVSRTIRRCGARILEVNPTYCTVLLSGVPEDIAAMHAELMGYDCMLQYTRSGRIAVTRSKEEALADIITDNE